MSEPSKLTEALSKVQGDLPTIPREATNPHYGSKYADLAAITEKVFPLLAANGLAWVTAPQIRDGVNVLVYELRHVSGETISGLYPLPPMGVTTQSFQAFGSALTYARRYVLSAVIGVATDEDTDGQGAVAEQAPAERPAPRKAARPAKPKAGDAESETAAAQRRKYHVLREQLGWDEQAGHDFISDLSDGRAERWTDLDTPAKRGAVLDKMQDEIDKLNSLGSAFPTEDEETTDG